MCPAFGEVMSHLHVHVIARPPGFPADERGPRIFASERRADEAERAGSPAGCTRFLATPVPFPARGPAGRGAALGPWRAVLLSGIFCPGAGQLTQINKMSNYALNRRKRRG